MNCPECNKKIFYLDLVCIKCGSTFYEKLDNPEHRISAYLLIGQTNKLIEKLNKKYTELFEERIIEMLDIISTKMEVDFYHKEYLFSTYEDFGDCYLKHKRNEEALNCYYRGYNSCKSLNISDKQRIERKIANLKVLLSQEDSINHKQIYDYLLKNSIYKLESIACEIIEDSKKLLTSESEEKIFYILNEIEDKLNPNRVADIYKKLGALYELHGEYNKATTAYKRGLKLNPNLAVKNALKRLKSL